MKRDASSWMMQFEVNVGTRREGVSVLYPECIFRQVFEFELLIVGVDVV